MIDDLCSQLIDLNLDSAEIKINGKVNDNKRFKEIDERFSSAKVGYVKHGNKKSWVFFEIKDSLKSYKKRFKIK